EKKPLPDDNNVNIPEVISLEDLSEYFAGLTDNLENNMGLYFTVQVDIADMPILVNQNFNIKLIANTIVNYIEESDESNQQRMVCFDCYGMLIIRVDVPATKVIIDLKHDIFHERPVDVTTPIEIKQEIKANLHMDPLQIRTYLQDKFDISKITAHQIRYWWSFFTQNFYKSEEDHVNSAYTFLKSEQAAGCELCFELMNSQIVAIGFITPLYNKIQQKSEIHCDATYKTVKGRFELYGIICNFEGSGYPLAYLILDTTKASENIQRIHYCPEDAAAEFNFIDLEFKPNLEKLNNEICPQNLRQK
ncbi:18943_t:CDS:2, partial [Racocetra fulgida]